MSMAFGILGGVFAVLIGIMFRHARLVLAALLIWWVYGWATSDPVRDQNEAEVRQFERLRIENQKAKVALSQVEVVFEKYGDREVRATVVNGAAVKISNVALRCSYQRPDEDDPWRLATPVASTGYIRPGESKRLVFWLRDAASDAMPSTFECSPVMHLDQADLMKNKLVRARTSDDRRIAQSDVQVEARLGQIKLQYAPVLAKGSIMNNSKASITYLSLTCSAIMNVYGRIETVNGGTSIYVASGEVKPFEFQVGKMHIENPGFGIRDVACQVLSLSNS